MKFLRLHLAIVGIALITLVSVTFLKTRISRGQTPTPKTESRIKPTSLKADRSSGSGGEGVASSSGLASAAARNGALRNDLIWTFGGKPQRGWYLYTPLMGRLLNTDADASSTTFAAALAKWQELAKLKPTGVLDEETLNAMVAGWQRNRLKNRVYAEPDQLLTAPASDFYDPVRPEELRQVERETYAAYQRMVAAAIDDPSLRLAHISKNQLAPTEKFLKIVSAFRSREYQDQLRKQSPNAGSAGLAVNSPHFTGRALDLYVGGDPVDTKDANRLIQVETPVYQWLARHASRFGFRPYYYEPWHWEYVGADSTKQ